MLRQAALAALRGVGDETSQWEEWTGRAYHIRRKLTEQEQGQTGPVRDIRGTPEALQRIEKVLEAVPQMPRSWAMEEA
jgi:hypothetical protein